MFNTKRYIIILISREIYAAVKNTLLLFLLLCITFLFLHYRLKVTLNYSHFVRYLYYHKKSFRKKKRQMLNHQEYSKFRFFRYSKITIGKFQIIFFPIWTKLLFRLFARRNHSSFAQKKKYETAGKFQITLISNFLIAHSTKLPLNLASLDTDTKSCSKFHARVFRSLAFAGNVSDFVPSDVLQELLITLCRALRTSRAPLFDRCAAAAEKKKKKRKRGKKKTKEKDKRWWSRRGTVEERPTWTWKQNLNELRGHAPVLPVYHAPSTVLPTFRRLSTVFSSLRGRGGI